MWYAGLATSNGSKILVPIESLLRFKAYFLEWILWDYSQFHFWEFSTHLIIFIRQLDQKVFMTIQVLVAPSVKNVKSLQKSPFKWSFSPFCSDENSKQ